MSLKEKAVSALSLFICRYKNSQFFFATDKNHISVENISSERKFHDVCAVRDFNKLCSDYGFDVPDADAEKRFAQGDHFCLITENDTWGCRGWYTSRPREFYVLEIDSYSPVPENASVLYHYFSNPEQRRKGFYYDLLRLIAVNNNKDYSLIYAYGSNIASRNAILKAGYRNFGEMNRKNFCGFENIIKKYNEQQDKIS